MYQKSNWYYYIFILLCNQHFLCKCNPLKGFNVRKARVDEFPFVVSITTDNYNELESAELQHNCAGALITRRHVLTSTSCMSEIADLSKVIIRVGSNDVRMGKHHKVECWSPYNTWKGKDEHGNFKHNNIAIVQLTEKVDSNIPLGVITRGKNEDFFGKNATAVGWGASIYRTLPKYLRAAELNILSEHECMTNMKSTRALNSEEISPLIFLCTRSEPPAVFASKDGGGPLIINGNEIIGINDFTMPTTPPQINIHTGVDFYKKFIKHQKKGILTCSIN